jgi:hypothetical protein
MNEALPVLLGFCFGGLSVIVTGRPSRATLAAGITGCIALAAVLISGEFRESWAYAIVDLLEAAAGFAAGSVVAWRYRISAVQK